MCTLIVLHRQVPGAPVVVAANRDEFHDRPAREPALRCVADVRIVAPQDLRAGGTWLGVNEHGLLAALTNRPTPAPDPRRRSRGLLVEDALAHGCAADAADALRRLPDGLYNPFNLVVCDETHAFVATYRERVRVVALGPGAHVIGNADPEAAAPAKLDRVRARAARAAQAPAARVLDALAPLCGSHEGAGADPLASLCVHAGAYGTRSSTLVRLGASGAALRHADGPPCRVPHRDLTPLLLELGLGAGDQPARMAS